MPNSQQAIELIGDGLVYWCIYVSPSLGELTHWGWDEIASILQMAFSKVYHKKWVAKNLAHDIWYQDSIQQWHALLYNNHTYKNIGSIYLQCHLIYGQYDRHSYAYFIDIETVISNLPVSHTFVTDVVILRHESIDWYLSVSHIFV